MSSQRLISCPSQRRVPGVQKVGSVPVEPASLVMVFGGVVLLALPLHAEPSKPKPQRTPKAHPILDVIIAPPPSMTPFTLLAIGRRSRSKSMRTVRVASSSGYGKRSLTSAKMAGARTSAARVHESPALRATRLSGRAVRFASRRIERARAVRVVSRALLHRWQRAVLGRRSAALDAVTDTPEAVVSASDGWPAIGHANSTERVRVRAAALCRPVPAAQLRSKRTRISRENRAPIVWESWQSPGMNATAWRAASFGRLSPASHRDA